jgi:hypothetical protein
MGDLQYYIIFLSVTAFYLGQQTNHFVNSVSNARIFKMGNAIGSF